MADGVSREVIFRLLAGGDGPERRAGLKPDDLNRASFREVLGHFCTGVTVVTAFERGKPVGTTCQAFTSVSLDPPLVAFCPSRQSDTYRRLRAAGAFCVNILGDHQEDISRRFSMKGGRDRFAGVDWAPSPSGSPIIEGSAAWVDCTIHAEYDGGDHLIVVGRVWSLGSSRDTDPLLFFRGSYRRVTS